MIVIHHARRALRALLIAGAAAVATPLAAQTPTGMWEMRSERPGFSGELRIRPGGQLEIGMLGGTLSPATPPFAQAAGGAWYAVTLWSTRYFVHHAASGALSLYADDGALVASSGPGTPAPTVSAPPPQPATPAPQPATPAPAGAGPSASNPLGVTWAGASTPPPAPAPTPAPTPAPAPDPTPVPAPSPAPSGGLGIEWRTATQPQPPAPAPGPTPTPTPPAGGAPAGGAPPAAAQSNPLGLVWARDPTIDYNQGFAAGKATCANGAQPPVATLNNAEPGFRDGWYNGCQAGAKEWEEEQKRRRESQAEIQRREDEQRARLLQAEEERKRREEASRPREEPFDFPASMVSGYYICNTRSPVRPDAWNDLVQFRIRPDGSYQLRESFFSGVRENPTWRVHHGQDGYLNTDPEAVRRLFPGMRAPQVERVTHTETFAPGFGGYIGRDRQFQVFTWSNAYRYDHATRTITWTEGALRALAGTSRFTGTKRTWSNGTVETIVNFTFAIPASFRDGYAPLEGVCARKAGPDEPWGNIFR